MERRTIIRLPQKGRSAPRLPHERDEAAGHSDATQAAGPDPAMRQAHADQQAGLMDTDCHGTPGLGGKPHCPAPTETSAAPPPAAAAGEP